MQIGEILQKTTDHFKTKGFRSARLDAENLLSYALNWKRIDLYLKHEHPLTETEIQKCREWVRRRSLGEPVAYICGTKGFYKNEFTVTPDVLIPRPETELVVEKAIVWLKAQGEGPTKIVDLGTGTGCIGLSILGDVPGAALTAVDVSEKAIAIAKLNCERLSLSERAVFRVKEIRDGTTFESSDFDLVVANPPYIGEGDPVEESVKNFEPSQALFSSEEGLAHFKVWSRLALQIFRPGGAAFFEIGFNQGPRAHAFLSNEPKACEIRIHKDYSNNDRVVEFHKLGHP